MLLRKPLPLRLNVGLFAVAVVTIPLIGQLWCRSDSPPRSLQELTELLSQTEPRLYLAPASPLCPHWGAWVSERPLCQDQVSQLRRVPEYADRWQGIVLCLRLPDDFCTLEEVRESWGEHGLEIGPIQCFGDPALLRRIQKAISGQRRAK